MAGVGPAVGLFEGVGVGPAVGLFEGADEGDPLATTTGEDEGASEGYPLAAMTGEEDGAVEGFLCFGLRRIRPWSPRAQLPSQPPQHARGHAELPCRHRASALEGLQHEKQPLLALQGVDPRDAEVSLLDGEACRADPEGTASAAEDRPPSHRDSSSVASMGLETVQQQQQQQQQQARGERHRRQQQQQQKAPVAMYPYAPAARLAQAWV